MITKKITIKIITAETDPVNTDSFIHKKWIFFAIQGKSKETIPVPDDTYRKMNSFEKI